MRKATTVSFAASIAVLAPFAIFAPAASAQDQMWITQFGTSENDRLAAMTSDGVGGVMVAGRTRGSLGGANAGGYDAFLARYNGAGDQLWLKQFGTSTTDEIEALCPDGAGGVMIAGWGGDLGAPIPATGTFIARYDSGGNRVWIRQGLRMTTRSARALAPDGAGGVFIGGSWGNPDENAVVARYDGDGNLLWSREFGTIETEWVFAAAPDGAGGVVVGGYTRGSLGGPNPGPILNPTRDAFLAHYDSEGNQLWIRQFGTPTGENVLAMASDGAGGTIAAGNTTGSLGAPHQGGEDIFVTRYDSAGNQLWLIQFGTSGHDDPYSLAPDGRGGVVMAGNTQGNLGGTNAGNYDAFLARYIGAGAQLWITQFGTAQDDSGRAVATDGEGGWMIAGRTEGSLGGPFQGGSIYGDAFLARYADDFCYADCDQTTGAGVLDLFDFLCFQNAFVGGCP